MIKVALSMVAGLVIGLPTVTPADIHFRHDVLRPGTARQAGLIPDTIAELPAIAAAYLAPTPDHPGHPAYAGATVLAAHHGIVVSRFAVGDAVRYTADASGIAELPPEQRVPARTDTLWDLASISKLFTTIVVLQQAEAGRVDLDAPVATYVPEFAAGGKAAVTVRHLLTHTSGLPAFLPFYSRYPTPETRLAAALSTPVTAGSSPGKQYVYSDIGLIALGALIERVTGTGLADAVHDGVTGPLRMRDTGYRPGPELRDRTAATEYQPAVHRGIVRGEVHDENAWSLGGVAGHAGIFSTADDLAVLCQTLLDGGTYRGTRILSTPMVRQALVNYNAELLPQYPDSARGLGFELAKHWYMDGMTSPVSFGHTGFTGTSIVIDPLDQSFLILLSNRVHPDRAWGSNNVARRALARAFAAAHPIRPLPGGHPWRTETRDGADLTLTAPLRRAAGEQARGSFLFWYDTEPGYDTVSLESSPDGATWTPVPIALPGVEPQARLSGFGGRHWWPITITVPAGSTRLRFTYHTDAGSQGRGVLVDRLRVVEPGAILVDGRTTFAADGWHL
ncbi:CubicO group peptidase (beta-lactamase class C family) [Actinoplanes octamycinicus]|uniref:CubicO group peptidase (Beta-lactamase class C family) n=1 Tax=Actinoplanes octamycinicus TaxID=135948 RepID=A0A7W7H0B7_9ACTN|nr:serine hydrolase domain-containing protein [Actinoplanes octamycinicus]MBB4741509.1 CubicO group peptidase (beta-lactamase class C family) [Actinoplanes octamycinicus]GIE57059.1 serine hydrolase [Actinoplanes octamycinicus]